MKRSFIVFCACLLMGCLLPLAGYGAYHHEGEDDSGNFLTVYPQKAHTKLDSCALCHKGGEYGGKNYGSCQYCHAVYNLTGTEHGSFQDTLNGYGLAYQQAGSSSAAVSAIEDLDSDGDGYLNLAEILADRYPGDANDDPTKVPAPSRVYTRAQLEAMAQHTQFMLMNATRSDDTYVEYTGVPMKDLLDNAGIMIGIATGIIVYSPDGFSYTHPLEAAAGMYHVYGNMEGQDYQYPPATYFYDEDADLALHPSSSATPGWCSWDAPSCAGRQHGDAITVGDGGLKAILALRREGQDLVTGVLNDQNKLDGEGPFRVVVPQVVPCAPDQPSTRSNAERIWPYVPTWDHNAGACSRTATIIKVEPLPEGTTDIDLMEAGWAYVDQQKIIVYGAIDGSDSNGNGILDSEEGTDTGKDFDGDTIPDFKDTDTATFNNPKGAGQIIAHTSGGDFVQVSALAETDPSIPTTGTPLTGTAYAAPYGVTGFTVTGLDEGATVTVSLRYPAAIPLTARYFKITSENGWVEIPLGSNDGDSTLTLTLTDGDPDTDADGTENGQIVDPGAVVVPSSASGDGDSDDGLCFMEASRSAATATFSLMLLLAGIFASLAGRGIGKRTKD